MENYVAKLLLEENWVGITTRPTLPDTVVEDKEAVMEDYSTVKCLRLFLLSLSTLSGWATAMSAIFGQLNGAKGTYVLKKQLLFVGQLLWGSPSSHI